MHKKNKPERHFDEEKKVYYITKIINVLGKKVYLNFTDETYPKIYTAVLEFTDFNNVRFDIKDLDLYINILQQIKTLMTTQNKLRHQHSKEVIKEHKQMINELTIDML
jgi:hypothetical protein